MNSNQGNRSVEMSQDWQPLNYGNIADCLKGLNQGQRTCLQYKVILYNIPGTSVMQLLTLGVLSSL